MRFNELYVSVDIEADGPIPGQNSMLSIGAAAFLPDGTMVGTFSQNLHQLSGADEDPATMKWWKEQPDAWAKCRENLHGVEDTMHDFNLFVRAHCKRHFAQHNELRPVFVGYPAGYDFLFVYWYLMRFTGYSPFGFSALDIKTMAMTMLDTPFRDTTKRHMPKRWFSEKPHTHVAVDDAIEQGEMFMTMLKELRSHGGFAS